MSPCGTGEQPPAVLRMRQVIPQRRVARVLLDPRGQILNQMRQAVGILGLICVEDLRLVVAALLRPRRRRPRQQGPHHEMSGNEHLSAPTRPWTPAPAITMAA